MLMLTPNADEYTPREPHKRWYKSPDRDKWSVVDVDAMGVVTATEEVVDHLLTAAGFVEGEPPAWAQYMPRLTPDPEHTNGSGA